MSARTHGSFAAALGLIAVLTVDLSTASADTRVPVDLGAGVTKRIVEDVVQEKILDKNDILSWTGDKVELSLAWARTIDVNVHLTVDAGPDVDINFQIGFDCDFEHPSILIHMSQPMADASYPWYVTLVGGGWPLLAEALYNQILEVVEALGDRIEEKLNEAVAEKLGSVRLPGCPEIEVLQDGTLHMLVGKGDECVNGRERMAPCAPNQRGRGIAQVCANGYWETPADGFRDCEKGAPPGGQVP